MGAPKSLQMVPAAMKLKDAYSLEGVDAWSWCTGTTQRDGMGRQEGGGFRMGNICIPVADSFRYLAKQYNIVKFKNKIKKKKQ